MLIFLDDYESEKETVQNEISIHRRLSHPNIVKYFTTKQIENAFLIFMEYVDGGSMYDVLQESGTFNNNLVIDYTYQILSGLVYMHSKEIVHRFVNPLFNRPRVKFSPSQKVPINMIICSNLV